MRTNRIPFNKCINVIQFKLHKSKKKVFDKKNQHVVFNEKTNHFVQTTK